VLPRFRQSCEVRLTALSDSYRLTDHNTLRADSHPTSDDLQSTASKGWNQSRSSPRHRRTAPLLERHFTRAEDTSWRPWYFSDSPPEQTLAEAGRESTSSRRKRRGVRESNESVAFQTAVRPLTGRIACRRPWQATNRSSWCDRGYIARYGIRRCRCLVTAEFPSIELKQRRTPDRRYNGRILLVRPISTCSASSPKEQSRWICSVADRMVPTTAAATGAALKRSAGVAG